MSRICIPFSTGDISALARSLAAQMESLGSLPGHVQLLNMLARSAGHRNFQSFREQALARQQFDSVSEPEPVDYVQVRRLARHFDAQGRLATWPAKTAQQQICLWVLWSRLPAGVTLLEVDLNRRLRQDHGFGDHALLRRELCDCGLLTRTSDGREYRRVERKPPPEARELIRQFNGRTR